MPPKKNNPTKLVCNNCSKSKRSCDKKDPCSSCQSLGKDCWYIRSIVPKTLQPPVATEDNVAKWTNSPPTACIPATSSTTSNMSSNNNDVTVGTGTAFSRMIDGQTTTAINTNGGSAFLGSVSNTVHHGGTVYNGTVIHYHQAPIHKDGNTDKKMRLIPQLTRRFVGREDILKKMQMALLDNRSEDIRILILNGIGGMGKTELMLKYENLHRKNYSYIFWLRVDGSKATLDEFRWLAKKLGIYNDTNKSDDNEVIELVREWLESRTSWLLLLDNMDRVEDVYPYIPKTGGDVIVTTRNHVPSSWGTVIDVDNMTNEEALQLLLGPRPICNNAKRIVHELGFFPLAINIARSYIEATG
ncbi:P-loop containing nucleoside triphosphate hydrolase protein, partial [Jimgerdemannia flammicorona]